MNSIKHIIITRAKFEDNDLLRKYLEISKKTYISSLHKQINKNFILCFLVNEKNISNIKPF